MKRIISLILVLATAFLTLTGCAFRYDKKDMSKYAEFDATAFKNALQALSITLGDFTADDAVRGPKVNDAVAQALLKATEATKKYNGTLANYDSVYFCYYATDAEGNIFFASKLDESKPTNIQLGLSTLDGLNAAIATALKGKDFGGNTYVTSATNFVKHGDVVSVSYYASWDDDNDPATADKTEVVWNQYVEVSSEAGGLGAALVLNGAKVGEEIPHQFTATVKEGNVDVEKKYSNVKIESLVKGGDNRTDKVADGDTVYVSYVLSFKATPFYNTTTETYDIPAPYNAMDYKIVGENIQITVSYEQVTAVKAAEGTLADAMTFENLLVDKKLSAGSTTSSLKEVGALTVGEEKIDFEYTNVKINWITKQAGNEILVQYTPYPDAYVEADKNEKTEKNIYGKAIRLNGVELTYHILPVYYIDVVDYTNAAEATDVADLIFTKLYSVALGTQTKEHDHVEGEEHEEITEYVFATLNDATFKKDDKTITTLAGELATLATTLKDKTTALTTALSSLSTAQKNLASTTYAQTSDEYKSLKTALENAETAYITAKTAEQAASAELNAKVDELLACTNGTDGAAAKLVNDYKTYHYDTLDAAFRADVKEKLAAEIIKILKSSVTFKDNLPKKAVKEAYNAIMDSYQYDFYEGKYSATGSTSSSTSTSTETNYAHYQGSFNRYLIDKVVSGNGGMKEVKAAIKAQAEAAVKEVMYVYIFTQMVEGAWDTELSLTKEEKKNIELNLEYQAYQIQMYYGVNYEYDIDAAFNGSQFDKVMEFLLTSTEAKNDNGVEVDAYTYINYTGK